MRIGLDILSEVAGLSSGTETYLRGFLGGLSRVADPGDEFFLFVNSGCAESYQPPDKRFRQVHFPFSNRRRPLRVATQLSLIPYNARRLNLDVVNFLGTTGAFFVSCARVQHMKTLHHIETPKAVEYKTRAFRSLLIGPSARAADVVIANCSPIREAATQVFGISPDRVVTIAEAVDHSTFYPRTDNDRFGDTLAKHGINGPYLLFVSSLWPYKNAHGLVEAYAKLLSRRQISHKLVIAGGLSTGNYSSELVSRVNALGLESRVQFLGHIADRSEVRNLYVGAEAFAYPSYMETFGLTVLESMACGTPVVASNRGSLPEVAGDAAWLVDPDDHSSMADAIWVLLSDRSKRDDFVSKGLRRAQQYTWERTASETLKAYQLAIRLSARRNAAVNEEIA